MAVPSYAWFYEHPFHTIFSATTTILSVLSNGLLIYVISTPASSKMGSYRYLLTVFAISDLCTSFAHTLLQPITHLTSSGLFFYPRYGPYMIGGESYDTVLCLMFASIFYQTFLILVYHFIYRLKTVTRGVKPSITDNWTMVHWVCLGVVANILYIAYFVVTCLIAYVPTDETRAIVPLETEEIYGTDTRNPNRGFVLIAIRRPDRESGRLVYHIPSILGLIALFVMFCATAIVISYCIWQINAAIRPGNTHFSAKTRKMQLNLFNSLLVQSAVPMLFSYVPLSIILIYPAATGIALGALGNVLISITSIFPAIDAFFVLFFIRKFRSAVVSLFHRPFHAQIGSSS